MDLNLLLRDWNPKWKKSEGEGHGFESSQDGFDSPIKNFEKQVKRVKKDSNPLHNVSNPWIWSCEEYVRDLNPRKKDSSPISRMKEIRLKDSNLRVTNLNPSLAFNSNFAKEIRIPEKRIWIPPFTEALHAWLEWPSTPNFKSNISHNG